MITTTPTTIIIIVVVIIIYIYIYIYIFIYFFLYKPSRMDLQPLEGFLKPKCKSEKIQESGSADPLAWVCSQCLGSATLSYSIK